MFLTDEEAKLHGATHRHYKGGFYKKLFEAHDSNDPSKILIVYESIEHKIIWIRTKKEWDAFIFNEELGHHIPRFRELL